MHANSSVTQWRSLTSGERARMRKLQLEKVEREQLIEEKEALKMTEEERQSLLSSFRSVKTEFYDLDGLSWFESSFCDELPGVWGQGFGHRPRASLAPTKITNNRVIGQNSLVQHSSKDLKAKMNQNTLDIQAVSGDTESIPLNPKSAIRSFPIRRYATPDQNQNPQLSNDIASDPVPASVCISRDDAIRASNYVRLPTSPTLVTCTPHTTYVAGIDIVRCPSSPSLGTIDEIGAPSFMDQLQLRQDTNVQRTPVSDNKQSSMGLGLPQFGDTTVNLIGSHREPSTTPDVDVTPALRNDSSLKQISDIPHTPLSRWLLSPSSQWVSSSVSPTPDASKALHPKVLGLGLTIPQPDKSQAIDGASIPQSTASRWLALYYGPCLSSQVFEYGLPVVASVNCDYLSLPSSAITPTLPRSSDSQCLWDSNLRLSQAFETPPPSLRRSVCPQSPSNPQWSESVGSMTSVPLYPQTSATSSAQECSVPTSPLTPALQSLKDIHPSTSSHILDSYSITEHLNVTV